MEIVRGKTFCRLAGGAAIDWLPEAALGWLSAGSRDLAPTILSIFGTLESAKVFFLL